MDDWQNLIPLHVEVPRPWFYDPFDGQRHRQMFTTVCMALAQRPFQIRMTDLPHSTYNVPRSAPEGGIMWSYHTIGDAPNVWRIKESPVYGYYTVDRLGYSAWSSLSVEKDSYRPVIEAIDLIEAGEHVAGVRKVLIERNLSKYDQSNEPFTPPGRYVFFPLQMIDDPVAQFARLDTLDVLAEAARLARETRTFLVVKRHPRCNHVAVGNALRVIAQDNPFVIRTTASIHPLIANCDAVLVANSGVGLEALFYNKPVYAFAGSEYDLAARRLERMEDVARAFALTHGSDGGMGLRYLYFYLTRCCFNMDNPLSVLPFLDRAIDRLGSSGAGVGTGAQKPDVHQQLLFTQSHFEMTRRELQRAQQTIKTLTKMTEEAIATANDIVAKSQAQGAGPETLRALAAAQAIGRATAEAAGTGTRARNSLFRMLERGYTAYADLAGLAERGGVDADELSRQFLASDYVAALDASVEKRSVGADAYQALHDEPGKYQANNWLMDHVPLLAGLGLNSVTEIGCGNGRFTKAIAAEVAKVHALDWARSPLLDPLPANVEFRQGSVLVEEIPAADLVCSADVLEHFEPRDLPGLLARLHAAGRMNYHVIACYDDGHSHLSVLHPGQWLALFRRLDPSYHLAGLSGRRDRADRLVCVITNGPTPKPAVPRPQHHIGAWMWPGNVEVIMHPERYLVVNRRVVGLWADIDDARISIAWTGREIIELAEIEPSGQLLKVTTASGDQFDARRLR